MATVDDIMAALAEAYEKREACLLVAGSVIVSYASPGDLAIKLPRGSDRRWLDAELNEIHNDGQFWSVELSDGSTNMIEIAGNLTVKIAGETRAEQVWQVLVDPSSVTFIARNKALNDGQWDDASKAARGAHP